MYIPFSHFIKERIVHLVNSLFILNQFNYKVYADNQVNLFY